MLEILIVLLLLLALAALVIPAAAGWFVSVQSDQVRQQVVELIKDELIESMRSRQPRVIWVSSRPLNGSAANPVPTSNESMGETAAADPREAGRMAQPAPTVRWVIGCRPLSSVPDHSGPSATADEPRQQRSLVDLPRGWLLAVSVPAHQEPEAGGQDSASEGQDGTPAQSSGTSDSGSMSASGAGPEGTLDSGEPAQVMILWPSGQIDVLIPIEVTEPDGRRWKLELNPWTLSVQWVLVFNPADHDEATRGKIDRTTSDLEERQTSKEPAKPVEPSRSDATQGPSAANKDAQEREDRDQKKPTKPDEQKHWPGDDAPG